MKVISYLLVGVQFLCIGLLSVTASFQNIDVVELGLFSTGTVLGLWAIYVMRVSKLHVTPEVDKEAMLITKGPYRVIRHPMYTAVLLVSAGLLITDMTMFRLLVFEVLFFDLIIKLFYEERLLARHFKNYHVYAKYTKRLVPFIF